MANTSKTRTTPTEMLYALLDCATRAKDAPLARVCQCALGQVGRAIEVAGDGARRELLSTQARDVCLAVARGTELGDALLPHRRY